MQSLNEYRGCHEEAIACYEAGLAYEPASAKAWFRYGIALFSLQRYLDAEGAYQRAIQAITFLSHHARIPRLALAASFLGIPDHHNWCIQPKTYSFSFFCLTKFRAPRPGR